MPEGLSASEAGKEIAEHAKHTGAHPPHERRDRIISIVEAILLSIVTLVAAWSGYSAVKWGTESSIALAEASAARTEANRALSDAIEVRNFDAETFNTWFIAYTARDETGMRLAEKRFRPEFRVAFDAWLATSPATNPDAPPGPTYMKEYVRPGLAEAKKLDATAAERFAEGSEDGATGDKYVRTTVFLASVLFLIGISTHFPIRGGRYALIVVGLAVLVFSLVQLSQLPRPPV